MDGQPDSAPAPRRRGRPPGSKDRKPRIVSKRRNGGVENARRTYPAETSRAPGPGEKVAFDLAGAYREMVAPRDIQDDGEPAATAGGVQAIRTALKKQLILDGLREGLSVGGCCKRAGCARSMFYSWQETDSQFAADVKDAVEDGTDLLEDAMAIEALRPNGFLARIATLKARRPERWKENFKVSHEHTLDASGALRKFEMFAAEVQQKAIEAARDGRLLTQRAQVIDVDAENAVLAAQRPPELPRPEPTPVRVDEMDEAASPAERLEGLRVQLAKDQPGHLPLLPPGLK